MVACGTVLGSGSVGLVARAQQSAEKRGLTALPGIRVGHHTLVDRPTGCTVVLMESGAVAAVDVRGGAPGTRETALLDPINTVQEIHSVVLAGGSAFGLAAADGVMRYLAERNVGFRTRAARVPIVPAAILYDLGIGTDPMVYPTADCGYRAASAASEAPIEEGSIGAGAGATVGKVGGSGRAMKGGIGTDVFELPGGVLVAALIAVNAVGDIVDPDTGTLVAGVRTVDGHGLADARRVLYEEAADDPPPGENTTIGVVATNVRLSKAELAVVARMAHDGFARSIRPSHTPSDGDTIFAVSTGDLSNEIGLLKIGARAADATAAAVLSGVRAATSLPGYPSVRDMHGGVR